MDTPRSKVRAHATPRTATAFEPVAAIEIDAVSPSDRGFTLSGRGKDRGEYRLALEFDLRLDPRTRTVLGELLSQSEITISRRGLSGGNS